VADALANPDTLDIATGPEADCGINAAAFVTRDTLLLASETDAEDFAAGENPPPADAPHAYPRLRPGTLGLYGLTANQLRCIAPLHEPAGTLMPAGPDHAVSFFNHPKLLHVPTGQIALRWPDLQTGQQTSSIIHHISPIPPLALDPQNRRFAVAIQDRITIVQLD
jgi:hypothetical protein